MKRFKKWSSFLLSLCMILALFPAVTSPVNAASASAKYKDVVQTEWYVPYVDYVVEHGLMSGTSSTTFVPNGKVTRAQYVQVLYAFAGKPAGAKAAGFNDVKAGAWYVNAVNWAASVGVTGGMTKTTFAPDRAVTREQAATFFRAYAEKVAQVSVDESKELSSFPDQSSVSKYAVTPMKWAVGAGLISGIKSGGKVILSPQGTLTRAQLATMMKAFDHYVSEKKEKNTDNINVVEDKTKRVITDGEFTDCDNGDTVFSPNVDTLLYDEEISRLSYRNIIDIFTFTDLTKQQARDIEKLANGVFVSDIGGAVNMLQLKVSTNEVEDIDKTINKLLENDNIFYAGCSVPIVMESNALTDPWSSDRNQPDGDRGNEKYPSGNDWWAEAIHAYSAWNVLDGLKNVTAPVVGIIDAGFETTHEDLQNTIVFPIEYTKNDSGDDSEDQDAHGTHVAGLISANNNEVGLRGVSDRSRLLCVDAWHGLFKNYYNMISSGAYVEATKVLIEKNAKVINNSWGNIVYSKGTIEYENKFWQELDNTWATITFQNLKPSRDYEKYMKTIRNKCEDEAHTCIALIASLLINDAQKGNFLICQSAGNGYDDDPKIHALSSKERPFEAFLNGAYASVDSSTFSTLPSKTKKQLQRNKIDFEEIRDHILIVGAVDNVRKEGTSDYSAADFSNYGDAVDIYAPGTEVFSTVPGNSYEKWAGTSMACPIVSGAAAFLWSIDPSLTAKEVKYLLVRSGGSKAIENITGKEKPMLDLYAATLSIRNLAGHDIDNNNSENTPNEYIRISNAQELNAVRNNLSGKYILMNDIELSSFGNWTPIGDIKNPFTGTFDGNGHKIHNMKITDSEIAPSEISVIDDHNQIENCVAGLFGCTSGATIKKIASVDGSIIRKRSDSGKLESLTAGGIAGISIDTTITDCSSDVDILYQYGEPGEKPSDLLLQQVCAGGIAGSSGAIEGDAVIRNCSAYGNITVTTHEQIVGIGGIAGGSGEGALIENCYSRCNIDAKTDSIFIYLGGILALSSTSQNILTVNNCCSNTTIKYTAGNEQGKKYEDSYYSVYVGGVTGYDKNNSNLSISNCYYLASSARGATGWAEDCLKDGEKILAHIDAKACSQAEIIVKATEMGFVP